MICSRIFCNILAVLLALPGFSLIGAIKGQASPIGQSFFNSVEVEMPAAEARIALVIGNGAYRKRPLNNPPNDARLIAETLKGVGFTVIGGSKSVGPIVDANYNTMKEAVRDFVAQIQSHQNNVIGLFYFAGHGVENEGKNYLIPTDDDIQSAADLEGHTISAEWVLRLMELAHAQVKFVILDACRNSPYRSYFRSHSAGLAEMDKPEGSLVAYSTAPYQEAEDGIGANSTYALEFARLIQRENVPVERVFKELRKIVSDSTSKKQIPWYSSSLTGDFYFVRNESTVPVQLPQDIMIPFGSEKNHCELLMTRFWSGSQVKVNSCLLSEDGKFRATIKYIGHGAIRFLNFEGREITCYRGELCSFGWPEAPTFRVVSAETSDEFAYIVSSLNQ